MAEAINRICFPVEGKVVDRVIPEVTAGIRFVEAEAVHVSDKLRTIAFGLGVGIGGRVQSWGDDYMKGFALAHRILREQAEENGQIFPAVTSRAVDRFAWPRATAYKAKLRAYSLGPHLKSLFEKESDHEEPELGRALRETAHVAESPNFYYGGGNDLYVVIRDFVARPR